jgi:tRNA(fMet)-specific endonuclease VapC
MTFWPRAKTRPRNNAIGRWAKRQHAMLRTLDTNICSYVLRRHPVAMLERFAGLNRQQLWLSAIVAAELRFGAAKLGVPRFTTAIEAWLAGFDIQDWPTQATEHYAHIRDRLERDGNTIGAMNLLIAAHALANDSVLVTNNAREFSRVPGLAVEEWQFT